jgi:hypothetical protein
MTKDEKNKLICDKVVQAFNAARDDNFRQNKEDTWIKCLKSYYSKLPVVLPKRSNLFIPETFKTIETMVAREKSAVWNGGQLFRFNARSDDYDKAEILSAYAKYDINRIPHIYRKMEDFLRTMHIYGTAILKTYWDYEDYEDEVVDKNGKTIKVFKPRRDNFNVDVISPRFFFPDPTAKTLQECKYIITRDIVDLETYREMVARSEYVKLSEEKLNSISQASRDFSYLDRNVFTELDQKSSLTQDVDRRFVEIIEYWSEIENRKIVVAGGKEVVSDGPIPFHHKRYPFLVAVDTPDPEHFFGLSVAEMIYDLQQEENAWRNNRMDKANFMLNPQYKVKSTSTLNRNELKSTPGGFVRVRDMDDIQPLDKGRMEQSDYMEEQNIKNDIQTTSGINDFAMGQGSGNYSETATGVSIISNNADAKMIARVEYIEHEVLKPMGKLWLSMQRQFMDRDEIFNVTGKRLELDKQWVFDDYDLETIASMKMMNRQTRQNTVMQLSQLMIQNPNVNQKEFLKYVLDIFEMPASKLLTPDMPGMDQQPQMNPLPKSLQGPGQPNPNQAEQMGIAQTAGRDFVSGRSVG